jgi:hypothetical protein
MLPQNLPKLNLNKAVTEVPPWL